MATPRPTSDSPQVGASVYTAAFYREVQNGIEYAGETRPTNADVIAERQIAIREGRLKVLDREQQNTQCSCAGCEAVAPLFLSATELVPPTQSAPTAPTASGLPLVNDDGTAGNVPWQHMMLSPKGGYAPRNPSFGSTLSVQAPDGEVPIGFVGSLQIRDARVVKENGNCETNAQDDCVQETPCRYWLFLTIRGTFYNSRIGAAGGAFPVPPVVNGVDGLGILPDTVNYPQGITRSYTRLGEDNDPDAQVVSTTTCTYELKCYWDVNCGVADDIVQLTFPNQDDDGAEYGNPIEVEVSAPWSIRSFGSGAFSYTYKHNYLKLTCGPCTGSRTIQPPI